MIRYPLDAAKARLNNPEPMAESNIAFPPAIPPEALVTAFAVVWLGVYLDS
jgi:hypothetical protein